MASEAVPVQDGTSSPAALDVALPRVTIQFCTQCRWMLRAAYFAQELISTFGTSLGEVALQPSTGGTFIVSITTAPTTDPAPTTAILWDRRTDGGFPETKELKRRVRDVIEPNRDLGHVDRAAAKNTAAKTDEEGTPAQDVAPHPRPTSLSKGQLPIPARSSSVSVAASVAAMDPVLMGARKADRARNSVEPGSGSGTAACASGAEGERGKGVGEVCEDCI